MDIYKYMNGKVNGKNRDKYTKWKNFQYPQREKNKSLKIHCMGQNPYITTSQYSC